MVIVTMGITMLGTMGTIITTGIITITAGTHIMVGTGIMADMGIMAATRPITIRPGSLTGRILCIRPTAITRTRRRACSSAGGTSASASVGSKRTNSNWPSNLQDDCVG
jgi:hypothetical protein